MTKKEIKYLILIIFTFIAACVETDIYLPAFPNMMKFFSVSENKIQALLTWNFIGICISGPFYGPLSDSYGRKIPLFIALGLFLLGSLITTITGNFDIMLLGRILQGLGSGGCFTLGTAIIFDIFTEKKAVAALNYLNTIIPLIMAAAPLLGGYLNNTFGYRSNFIFITIFVFISFFICLMFFKESLATEKRINFNKLQLLKDFKKVLFSILFWELTLIISLLFGGYLAFVSGTSILFVMEMGVTKNVFPFYQVALLGSYVLASLTCSRAIAKFGVKFIKKIAVLMIVIGGIGLAIVSIIYPKNPVFLTFIMMFYSFGCSWVMSPYFGECMGLMPEIKGITASLLTSIRLLMCAFIVGVSSKFYNGSISPITIIIGLITVFIVPMIIHYEKNKAIK